MNLECLRTKREHWGRHKYILKRAREIQNFESWKVTMILEINCSRKQLFFARPYWQMYYSRTQNDESRNLSKILEKNCSWMQNGGSQVPRTPRLEGDGWLASRPSRLTSEKITWINHRIGGLGQEGSRVHIGAEKRKISVLWETNICSPVIWPISESLCRLTVTVETSWGFHLCRCSNCYDADYYLFYGLFSDAINSSE